VLLIRERKGGWEEKGGEEEGRVRSVFVWYGMWFGSVSH
jgi:hypothetical protein